MQKLEEKVLLANWKSYKTFKHSGEIRLYTQQSFKELHFAQDKVLSLKVYKGGKPEVLLQSDQWTLEFKNKRHYLLIAKEKLTYEIVTVNHTVLVLLDNANWEKTFFAKEHLWADYLQTNEEVVM